MRAGETVTLTCIARDASADMRLSWSMRGGAPLRGRARDLGDGRIVIDSASRQDQGVYECSGVDGRTGANIRVEATVRVEEGGGAAGGGSPPTRTEGEVSVNQERQTAPQGSTAVLVCSAPLGAPEPVSFSWSKISSEGPGTEFLDDPDNSLSDDDGGATLTLRNVDLDDRGVYVCTLDGSRGYLRYQSILSFLIIAVIVAFVVAASAVIVVVNAVVAINVVVVVILYW